MLLIDEIKKRTFAKIALGFYIRGSIKNVKPDETDPDRMKTTYRVMRGNGFYGTEPNKRYQQKYRYTVSDPNCDHVGEYYKQRMRDCMTAWANLTPQKKIRYHERAAHRVNPMWGQNLFFLEYIKTHP